MYDKIVGKHAITFKITPSLQDRLSTLIIVIKQKIYILPFFCYFINYLFINNRLYDTYISQHSLLVYICK